MLFNFDTVSDHISVAQGTLLLSYYCSEREPVSSCLLFRKVCLTFADDEHNLAPDSDPVCDC